MGKILTGHEGNLASPCLDLLLPGCSVFLPAGSSKGIPTAPSAVTCASKERVEPRGHTMLLRKVAGNANLSTLFPGQGKEWSAFHTLADPILTTAQSQLLFSLLYSLKKKTSSERVTPCGQGHVPILDLKAAGPSRVCLSWDDLSFCGNIQKILCPSAGQLGHS